MKNLLKKYSTQITELGKKLSYSPEFLAVCCLRGLDTPEKIKDFLNPTLDKLLPPDTINDLKKACDKIKDAVKQNKKILVYGDYDCDGICSTVLFLDYFEKEGIKADYFIPQRNKHGYGLSKKAVDEIFSKTIYDLVITVDCGITNVEEVEYIKSFGADVIVTDHHTLPETLPDCTVVDPKIGDTPLKDLCGAGVVWKMLFELGGEQYAKGLLDVVTLATVADIVPLTGENRIIVKNGLEAVYDTKRYGLKILNEKAAVKPSPKASELSFSVIPRINAAGRMDRADVVVPLFFSKDPFLIDTLTDRLIKLNEQRQELCDEIYESAVQKLTETDLEYKNVILLYDTDWEKGAIGIVAARIAKDFRLPAVLFKEESGFLHGSARSIDGVNIFEALKSQSEYFTAFGGHSQAAGVTLKKEDFPAFQKGLNSFLENKYGKLDKTKIPRFDVVGTDEMLDLKFLTELSLLEPYGEGNRPLNVQFKLKGNFKSMKNGEHYKYETDKADAMFFRAAEYKTLLTTGAVFDAYGSLEINRFRGVSKPNFKITGLENVEKSKGLLERIQAENVKMRLSSSDVPFKVILVKEPPIFEEKTAYVCFTEDAANKIKSVFPGIEEYFMPTEIKSLNSVLCYGLDKNFKIYPLKNVVFLERPESFVRYKSLLESAKVYCVDDFAKVEQKVAESDIISLYDTLNKNFFALKDGAADIFTLKARLKIPLSDVVFAIAFSVLYENGSISVKNGDIIINKFNSDFTKSKFTDLMI